MCVCFGEENENDHMNRKVASLVARKKQKTLPEFSATTTAAVAEGGPRTLYVVHSIPWILTRFSENVSFFCFWRFVFLQKCARAEKTDPKPAVWSVQRTTPIFVLSDVVRSIPLIRSVYVVSLVR
jgi:hypothetical protein